MIGEARISELIKSVTGQFADTFQDAWVRVIEEKPKSEEEVLQIARKCHKRDAYKEYFKSVKEVSIDVSMDKDDEGGRTLRDILPEKEEVDESELEGRVYKNNGVGSKIFGKKGGIENLIKQEYKMSCKNCDSGNISKYGTQREFQRYVCNVCGSVFCFNGAYPNMQYPRYVVQEVIRLAIAGLSYSQISRQIYQQYKVKLYTSRICVWLKKFGVEVSYQNKHCRRHYKGLLGKLRDMAVKQNYTKEEILEGFGYSRRTKLEDTQLFLRGIIIKRKGRWSLNYNVVEL